MVNTPSPIIISPRAYGPHPFEGEDLGGEGTTMVLRLVSDVVMEGGKQLYFERGKNADTQKKKKKKTTKWVCSSKVL
jgi:hypothetical protein